MNQARVGFNTASRDWTAGDLPSTVLANDGIMLGAAVAAGRFGEQAIELNDVVSVPLGNHLIRVGGSIQRRTHDFEFTDGIGARYAYGSVADFAAAQGFRSETLHPTDATSIGVTQYGGFLQDRWSISRRLVVSIGVHLDRENLPVTLSAPNVQWGLLSGINSAVSPVSKLVIAPRGTLSWVADGAGRTVIQLGGGLAAGQFDASSLAEVAARDGTVLVRRSHGFADMADRGFVRDHPSDAYPVRSGRATPADDKCRPVAYPNPRRTHDPHRHRWVPAR